MNVMSLELLLHLGLAASSAELLILNPDVSLANVRCIFELVWSSAACEFSDARLVTTENPIDLP